jgi:hypothetical protein
VEDVDAAADALHVAGEIEGAALLEISPIVRANQLARPFEGEFSADGFARRAEVAADAEHGRQTWLDVQVAGTFAFCEGDQVAQAQGAGLSGLDLGEDDDFFAVLIFDNAGGDDFFGAMADGFVELFCDVVVFGVVDFAVRSADGGAALIGFVQFAFGAKGFAFDRFFFRSADRCGHKRNRCCDDQCYKDFFHNSLMFNNLSFERAIGNSITWNRSSAIHQMIETRAGRKDSFFHRDVIIVHAFAFEDLRDEFFDPCLAGRGLFGL